MVIAYAFVPLSGVDDDIEAAVCGSNTSLPAVELDDFHGVGVAAGVVATLHLALFHCRVPQQRPYQPRRGSSGRGRRTRPAFEPKQDFTLLRTHLPRRRTRGGSGRRTCLLTLPEPYPHTPRTCRDEKNAAVAAAARALSGPLVLMPQSPGGRLPSVCFRLPGTCRESPSHTCIRMLLLWQSCTTVCVMPSVCSND